MNDELVDPSDCYADIDIDVPDDDATLLVLEETCACGCTCLACPDCGGIRCLHCDPLCAAESTCHTGGDKP